MSKFVLLAAAAFLAGAVVSSAQNTPDVNPDHGSSATFGNDRPLIQKKGKAPTSRTVTGIVTDESGKPLAGALVTLTNGSTKEHREFFTKRGGQYRFEDLSFTIDYKVQASYKGRRSRVKPMSQYDRTPNIVRMLAIPSATVAEAAPAQKTTAQAKK
ncbi:MAG: carboxypeptidase-like regulatory domain-containing protein [Bryobacteraceae bacterium]